MRMILRSPLLPPPPNIAHNQLGLVSYARLLLVNFQLYAIGI